MDKTLTTLNEIDNIQIARAIHCDIEEITQHLTIKENDLKVVCQNIRSVYGNIDDLKITLSTLAFVPDIIILTECHINPNKPTPALMNYSSFVTTQHLNQCDGVVIYVKNEIVVTNIKEVKLQHASCIQIDTYNSAILGIYCSPSNKNADQFLNSFNVYLETMKTYKNITIAGDINIKLNS